MWKLACGSFACEQPEDLALRVNSWRENPSFACGQLERDPSFACGSFAREQSERDSSFMCGQRERNACWACQQLEKNTVRVNAVRASVGSKSVAEEELDAQTEEEKKQRKYSNMRQEI